MRTTRSGLVLLLALGSLGNGPCGGSVRVLENTGFDLWCGDDLCGWTVEKGDIERTPTWHEEDHGVSLVGDEVVLSQPGSGATEGACLRAYVLANIDPDVTVTLSAAYDDASASAFEHTLPSSGPEWTDVSQGLSSPRGAWNEVTFRIRKRGEGRAQLAQIVVRDECPERDESWW